MMHEEDDWPRRGSSRRSRPVKRHGPPRQRIIEEPPESFDDDEEIHVHERGGPWGGRRHGPPPFVAFGPGPGRGASLAPWCRKFPQPAERWLNHPRRNTRRRRVD